MLPRKKNEQAQAIIDKATELNVLFEGIKLNEHQKNVVTNINQTINYLLMSIGA